MPLFSIFRLFCHSDGGGISSPSLAETSEIPPPSE